LKRERQVRGLFSHIGEILRGEKSLIRQVEFDGEHATHRFVDGISLISHAHLVARSVGLSKDDIDRMLKEKLDVTAS